MDHPKQTRQTLSDDVLIGKPWSRARLWNREPLDDFYEEALEKYGSDDAISEEQEKKLKRKIDWTILPVLSVCYAFYYIDKTTLSYAAIFGIKDDLNLKGTEYSWLSSIFYFGWLIWALPTNMLMLKSPPAKYLAINIFLWGILLMHVYTAQAGVTNFAGLAALRILSGAAEAIADPAFMLITVSSYTRAEQPSRISTWYAANGLGVAGGGMLGYGIGHINGALSSWRYEFLIVGALCSIWGVVIYFILPDSPVTSQWLTRDERLMAVARLRKNQTGIDNKQFKWYQAKEAFLKDPKTYMFFFLGVVGNIPNGGISNFSTLILNGLGFDVLETSLLGIPQGALVMIYIGLGAFLNDRLPKNSRTFVCMLFMIPTIAGTLGFLFAPQSANVARLICYYLTGSYQASFVLGVSLITSNVAGQTKKQIASAMIWLGACVGNIGGPFFYRSQDAPEYRLGIASMLVCNCLEVLIFVLLRIYFMTENRRRDRLQAKMKAEETAADTDAKGAKSVIEITEDVDRGQGANVDINATAFADLTDFENLK
ncbi:major facilitator superfamily domain-containing protein [Schizophyllum amplum]|uniref:Major facilitator superfamily domain-containing protein n=1 Tax=Schizophyllum amplum TaxID=97359 RepID=A0A550CAP9_9AGAR|nr:major facilitator superfamily domain-containing protein [Auriculariopsis ampla]